jgi:uncharacterized damage-inducible protein DinB
MISGVIWTAPEAPVAAPMPDVGPIRPVLQGYLDHYRRTVLRQCAGLSAEEPCTRASPPSTLSLLGLVRHLTEVERTWLRRRAAGQTLPPADRDGQFEPGDPAGAPALLAAFAAEWAACDAAVAHLPLGHLMEAYGEQVSLGSVYVHLVEEYARHCGHGDLIREAIDGATNL